MGSDRSGDDRGERAGEEVGGNRGRGAPAQAEDTGVAVNHCRCNSESPHELFSPACDMRPAPKPTPPGLIRRRENLIAYAKDKLGQADWHAVADAANDLRELDVEIRMTK